jgi:DNA-binding XRE family transcriptional regulator
MVEKGRTPNRLKKYRCMHGYSQTDLARKLGMKKSNLISQWEKGTVIPSLDNLLKLCVLYNTLIEELYFERLQVHRSLLLPPAQQARIINID